MLEQCLIDKFYKDEKFIDVSEIVNEERVLKELKSLYVKHAFDGMSHSLKVIYETQFVFVKNLKLQYARKYGFRDN